MRSVGGWGPEVTQALAALQEGQPVILLYEDVTGQDAGDLLLAAEYAVPSMMVSFVQHTAGFVCVALGRDRAGDLGIPTGPGPADGDGPCARMAFSAMVDQATAGQLAPSAVGRSRTVRALADPSTRPGQLVRSGHVPVVTACPGGVLEHAGRAEAAVDLVRLAGLASAVVMGEILSADALGMASRVELDALAGRLGVPSVRIAEVVAYRYRLEGVVRRAAEARLPTVFGDFRCVAYQSTIGDHTHVALVRGDVTRPGPVLVGIHTESVAEDVLGSALSGYSQLQRTMRSISRQRAGVLIYLRSDDVLGTTSSDDRSEDTTLPGDVVAQILIDLGMQEVCLLPGADCYSAVLTKYGLGVSDWALVEGVP